MSTKYRVTITGLKPDGVSEGQARANLAKLLKAPAGKIDRLLDSVPVVVKKGVDREMGEKYTRVLAQAGALARLEPEELELSLEPTEEKITEEKPQFTCPQCGVVVERVGKCPACVEKNNQAIRQNSSTAKKARRRERNEKIRLSAVALLIEWIRGNIWKAAIVFILVPIFGTNFLVSTVFYTQDKHLVYQTLSSRTLCVKNPVNVLEMYSSTDQELFDIFWGDFNEEERAQLLKRWNNVACRTIYEMELGNIGDEPITTNIELDVSHFYKGAKTSPVWVFPDYRNLSSSSPREQDPVVKQTEGKMRLENIYPGTHIGLKFAGWIDGKESAQGWERVLSDISVDDGVVEVGDPLATTFGRLLTVFF